MQLLVNSLLIAPWILQPTLSAFAEAIPSSIAVEEKPFSSQLNENFSTREFITGQDIIPESTTATETCSQDNEELETTRVETIFESVVALESTTTLPPFKTQETFSTSETIPTDSFKIEKIVQPIPTTAEIARDRQLAQADKRYQCGELLQAEKLYREVKKPFAAEVNLEKEKIREPISQPEQLQPGGAVYWRLYQEGLEDRHLESKILAPLKLLTEQYPEFIPAHLHYARALKETGKEQEAMQVLQHAITLYPNEVELVQAKIEAHQATEDWLEASLTARQFALFNPKHPRSAEFISIADENLERYKDDLESEITWSAIGNVLVGGIGLALTGNIFGTLSAIETTVLLLEGESSIGDRYSASVQQELPMVRDEEVLGYVREIGNKLASVAGRDEFNYEFHVIMDDRLNAFALPGGKIFINAGAILNSHSEAELAGLLAHELAHAVLSHGFQLMAQGSLTSNITQYIPYVGRLAGDLIVFNYSRDMEEQADLFGTRLLAASGYAADGVRNLMVTLNEQDDFDFPAWLSTHPDTQDRVRYLEGAIVQQGLNRYAYEGVTRHRKIQQRVVNLWVEDQKVQGAKEEGEKKGDR